MILIHNTQVNICWGLHFGGECKTPCLFVHIFVFAYLNMCICIIEYTLYKVSAKLLAQTGNPDVVIAMSQVIIQPCWEWWEWWQWCHSWSSNHAENGENVDSDVKSGQHCSEFSQFAKRGSDLLLNVTTGHPASGDPFKSNINIQIHSNKYAKMLSNLEEENFEDPDENIARGTTDPGYWLFNLSYLSSWI